MNEPIRRLVQSRPTSAEPTDLKRLPRIELLESPTLPGRLGGSRTSSNVISADYSLRLVIDPPGRVTAPSPGQRGRGQHGHERLRPTARDLTDPLTVVRLIDEGEPTAHVPGAVPRRLRLADVLAYREELRARRNRVITESSAEHDEADPDEVAGSLEQARRRK